MKKYLPEGYIFDTRENKEALKNLSSLEIAFKEQKQLEAKEKDNLWQITKPPVIKMNATK